MKKTTDFLIVGGGIFGLSAAIELSLRRYKVTLLNPDSIPHALAGSTDISKIVRAEYGDDQQYFDMAMTSIQGWEQWNDMLDAEVFHKTGMLMLMQKDQDDPRQYFERKSVEKLDEVGLMPGWLDADQIQTRFPAFDTNFFPFAHFNQEAGYVESGLAIKLLAAFAKKIGVKVLERQTVASFHQEKGRLTEVKTKEGSRFSAGQTIVAAGAQTSVLVPELQSQMKATGHPVFHFRPENPALFSYDKFPVFTGDISNTGWYGFPYHPKEGVVKIALHSNGSIVHPEWDDRRVSDKQIADCREFLAKAIPALKNAPLVNTRLCLYADTLDGHFWIDEHPEIKGLSVASGGSGHAMKMGPMLGLLIADMATGEDHPWLDRFRWRKLDGNTDQVEAARFVVGRKL